MASSSDHIYPLSAGFDAVSLYAEPCGRGWTAYEQALLPDFGAVYHAYVEDTAMKGVWGGDKNVSKDYKPAIDSLYAVDAELLRQFIAIAVATGVAVSFSVTRDFGATVLTVLDGKDKHKVYPTDVQELDAALRDGIESFGGTPPPPSTKAAKR